MSNQKYTVVYQKPYEEVKHRTRFSSLKITKQREKRMSERGWRCKIISKNDYPIDEPTPSMKARRFNNRVNYWQFIPQKDGDTLCIKNGQYVPIAKCMY